MRPSSTMSRLITLASTGRRMQSSGSCIGLFFRLLFRHDLYSRPREDSQRPVRHHEVARGDALRDLDFTGLADPELHLDHLRFSVCHPKHEVLLALRDDGLLRNPDRLLARAE